MHIVQHVDGMLGQVAIRISHKHRCWSFNGGWIHAVDMAQRLFNHVDVTGFGAQVGANAVLDREDI